MTSSDPERTGSRGLVVGLAAVLAFATSASNPFIPWDDDLYVTASARTQRPGVEGLLSVWRSDDVWQSHFIEFFPLRDTVYWATWQTFGNNPTAFHVVSLIAHALVSLLVLRLGRKLGLPERAAFWGAMLFAVHPVHVESVTWVSALKDPMFTGFLVGSVLAFLDYRRTRRPSSWAWCLVLMVASLLCKSIGIALPLLLLAIDRWLEPTVSWKQSLTQVAGPGVIAALFAAQFTLIGRLNGVLVGPHGGSWPQHGFLMSWAMTRYVQQAVVPVTFRIHYCFTPLSGPFDLRLGGIALLVASVAVVLVSAWHRNRLAGLLVLWFFVCLLPVANLVPFPAIMADRYLYAPSVASCLLLAWGLHSATAAHRWVLPVVTLVLMAVTSMRGVIWRDPAQLWAEAVEGDACAEDLLVSAVMMYLNHAQTQADPQVALVSWKKAFVHPRFRDLLPSNQAIFLRKAQLTALATGDRALALEWSARAIEVAPWDSRVWLTRVAVVGDPTKALEAAHEAFRLEKSADTRWALGLTRLELNQPIGVNDLLEAVHLSPRTYCDDFLELLEHQLSAYRAQVSLVERQCREGLARAEP